MSALSTWTVAQLAEALGATVQGDGTTPVTGVAFADNIAPGTITYATNATFLAQVEASAAAAVIVDYDLSQSAKPLLQVDVPKAAFARVMELFYPAEVPPPGTHASAVVAADARVDRTCSVGAHVVIGADAVVGARCVLHPGVHIGAGVRVGADSELFDHAVLYPGTTLGARVRIHAQSTIGADGFGYVFDGMGHRKIPQVGTVEIGDDVEIGAGVCIDRGTLGATRIGSGVRIDNLVQIGHNVIIGDHAILVAQTGISGSTTIGSFAVFGGQAGVADHLTIGAGAIIGAATKVGRNVRPGQTMFGLPARPAAIARRQIGAVALLPKALKRLRRLEKVVEALRAAVEGHT